MAKRDPASKWLDDIVKLRKRHVRTPRPSEFDLSDPIQWAQAAKKALTLPGRPVLGNYREDPVKRAFDELMLDPHNPEDWGRLVYFLASAHFLRRKRGVRRDTSRYNLLIEHLKEAWATERGSRMNFRASAKVIKARHPNDHQKSEEALRKELERLPPYVMLIARNK
jgi:hypothetical protein